MKEIAIREERSLEDDYFTRQQLDILKNTICKGASDDEFQIFKMACIKTRLDPFMKQIYAVKRKCKKPDGTWGEVMSIQTGIDGYRLIADRTGKYVPGQEPTFKVDDKGNLISATAYIKKMTSDGTWHTVSASAYYEEYCQTINDRNTGEKKPTGMWTNMAFTMLAKCAEAQALRKAFPAEMSGVYTKEEMHQADTIEIHSHPVTAKDEQMRIDHQEKTIDRSQADVLMDLLKKCPKDYNEKVTKYLHKHGLSDLSLPVDLYNQAYEGALKKYADVQEMEKEMLSKVLDEPTKEGEIL